MNEVGRLIADRYRLTQHIGSGAMGAVWQAHDERLHRTVALKALLLQPGLSEADTNEARNRAMREGRIAARLQHPNAVTVYDVVEDAGQPVLIMEYVPSRSLSTVLEQHSTLSPQEVARIGQQVATALVAAHAAGIVHRDIKPGNVLLSDDGTTVKITDFGISRATGDVQVTATGMLAGTPAYLAPEVAKGEPPGPPSDVFSLGSTLYAAVEGHPPFGNIDNTLALLHAVAAGRTIPPRQAGPLTGTLQRMLSTNPDARPTMPEVVRVLGAIAAGQAPQPTGPPSGPTAMTLPPPRPLDHVTTVRTRPPGQPTPPPMRVPAGSMPSMAPASAWPPKRIAIYAAAILAAALVGILVANMFTDTGDASAAGGPGTLTPVEQTMAAPAPAASSSTMTTTQTTNPSTQNNNGFDAMKAVLYEYFGLLPGQAQQAFQLLTPAQQARNGGMVGYQLEWAQVSSVHVDSVSQHNAKQVLAKITLVTRGGQSSSMNGLFTFAQSNGQLLISDIVQAPANPGKHGA